VNPLFQVENECGKQYLPSSMQQKTAKWIMPVTPSTQEPEIRMIMVHSQSGQKKLAQPQFN
jgi:hypothetical protein